MTGERGWRGFLTLVYDKAAEDNIFFLASGMTFGILVTAVPFLLLLLSVAGLVLSAQFEAPRSEVLVWFWEVLPAAGPEVRAELESNIQQIADQAGSVGLLSGIAFVWFSTRVFGALRTVLSEVFDLRERLSVVRGKLMDVGLVLVSTVLLCLNIVISSAVTGVGEEGLLALGLETSFLHRLVGFGAAFLFIFLMFLLIYKFVSLNRVRWRTSALAALVASVGFELLKTGFGWWVANYATYSTFFFAFATLVVVVLSIYYGSVLFVLGGEVAQVAELQRTLRRQRELFDGG